MLLWSDHAFDTKALLQLAAACAQSYGFQGQPNLLYTYQTKRGVGLGTVVDWLLPYARVPSAKWPYMQILPFDSAPATATVCRSPSLSRGGAGSEYTTIFRMAANAPVWAARRALGA